MDMEVLSEKFSSLDKQVAVLVAKVDFNFDAILTKVDSNHAAVLIRLTDLSNSDGVMLKAIDSLKESKADKDGHVPGLGGIREKYSRHIEIGSISAVSTGVLVGLWQFIQYLIK